jgi:hypothetical protein
MGMDGSNAVVHSVLVAVFRAAAVRLGTFTTSTAASPARTFPTNTWTDTDLAEQAAMVVIDVKAEDLDIDGGFDCIICNVSDVGTNVQLGCLFYYLHEPRNSTRITSRSTGC